LHLRLDVHRALSFLSCKILMNRRYHLCAITNGRSDPLDRPRTDVAHGEDAALVGLVRKAVLAARCDEATFVEL